MRVFDLDGTLFDTFEATKFAYEKAGLPEFKPEYFFRSRLYWGCSNAVHREKQRIFREEAIARVKLGWAYDLYKPTDHIILTGASADTVQCLRSHFGVALCCPFGYSLGREAKLRVLFRLASLDNVYYYDDDLTMKQYASKFLSIITPGDPT